MTKPTAITKPTLDGISKISVLGATGSVGMNTLDVVQQHPTKFSITALTTNNKIGLLHEQCQKFRPKLAVVADESFADKFIAKFNRNDYMPETSCG